MTNLRQIRDEELNLITHLLQKLGLDPIDYPVNLMVDDYEGGKMGSISLGGNPDAYARDLIQAEYVDIDGTPVVITLTMDEAENLLDLDFWKIDFSKLLEYPTPEKLIFSASQNFG